MLTLVDIIILDLNGGDLAIHFVTPDFYNKFLWTQDEVVAFDKAENNADQWKVAKIRRGRIEEISFEDVGVLKVIYSQEWTNGEDVNTEFKIGRIMNLPCC